MATISELETNIAHLEDLLNSGASSVTVDGVTTSIDVGSVRKRLKELKLELAKCQSSKPKRPLFVRVDLSGDG